MNTQSKTIITTRWRHRRLKEFVNINIEKDSSLLDYRRFLRVDLHVVGGEL